MINLEGLRAWGGLAGAPLEEAGVVVAGIAYDGSAVYRKGAAAAPSRVRQLSAVMPPVTESGWLCNGERTPGGTTVPAMKPPPKWTPYCVSLLAG